jgi:magnesium-transporting ATPase (P-type)
MIFLLVLWRAGWHPGAPVGPGTALDLAYRQATTATFAGIVACQVGTAFAARTERTSLRSIGLSSNRLLLWAILGELVFTAVVVYFPPAQRVFGTAALPGWVVLLLLPFPAIVWSADEALRAAYRKSMDASGSGQVQGPCPTPR